jgi:hypothetical protein
VLHVLTVAEAVVMVAVVAATEVVTTAAVVNITHTRFF